jgi:hypothetical protein
MDHTCADFCDLPAPTASAPDDAHGPWCVSPPVGREVVAHAGAGAVEITVDRVQPWVERAGPACIRLVVDPLGNASAPDVAARLTTGSARQLAATLLHAADLADELLPHASGSAAG